MAKETLITDLVAQDALDQLDKLDTAIEGTLGKFQDCARELARGLKVNVEVNGDLDRLKDLSNTQMQRAGQAVQQYMQQLQQQQQVIANTTNTISRQLMEQEKLNKSQRAAFTQNQEALRIAEQIVGTYEENTRQLAKYTAELAKNKATIKEVEKLRSQGAITDAEAVRRTGNLMAEQNKLKAAMQEVAGVVRVQAKEMNAAEGSYVHLSQQLELLKKAQKGLNEEEKAGEEGKALEAEIQNLDARLKDLAADMGEFQRNVGNYAIAQGGLKKSYGELQEVITGLTIQYREMDDAQRESEEGQALKEQIDALTKKAGVFRAAMDEVNASVANSAAGQQITRLTFELTAMANEYGRMSEAEKQSARGNELSAKMTELTQKIATLKGEVDAVATDAAPQSIRKDLKEMTMEIATCTLEYEHMTAAEKESAAGQELKAKIQEMTEKAGELKDVLGDVKESISNSASDTRAWDTLNEAGQVTASVFGLCATAAQAFGVSEESLQASMLKVQQAMQAVQALQVIQNATQKQSNLMKGIAILQSKAAAAAARIEAAATTSATGATKAQTIAQAAFNAVAKANPYVLLATAILAVIGLVVGYTAATKDATKADEEAKKAADARKESMDNMAQSFGNTAGEMIAKYKVMREQWNALGDDIAAKRKYLVQHKSDFEALAKSAGESADSVGSVQAVEKNYMNNTPNVEKAIKRRAMAMAAYAEYIRITQLKLQELEKLSTFSYRVYKAGDRVDRADFAKAGLKMNEDQKQAARYSGYGGGIPDTTTWLTAEQASQMTTWSREQGNKAALEAMDRVTEKYDAMAERAWKHFVNNGGLEPANFAGGGGGGGGKNTPGKGGGKNTPGKGGGKNAPQVKSAEEIQTSVNDILLEGYQYAVKLEDEYTEEWAAAEKKRIKQKETNDIDAAEKKRDALIKDIQESKIAEEEKQKAIGKVVAATDDIIKGIHQERKDAEKKLDDDILQHKQEVANKEVEKIANTAAGEQVIRNQQYQNEVAALYKEYNEALKTALQKGEDTTKVTELYNKKKEELDNKYANETVQATIDALNKELQVADLSEEEREDLQRQLTEATTQLAQQRAEQEKKKIEDTVEADKKARDQRNQNLQDWVQKAGEAISRIGDFMSAMYDNQIAKIDELLEAEQQRYDQEVENIEYLADRGAITTEEAEIRKREAAAATAAKQEQLEKRKAQIEYKKALMEKANSIAQIGIATALGIMKASPKIPLMAFVGAMGAIQTATALAQPIKAYKEGTKKPHPGGLALVGDGDKAEVVLYNGKAWVTPDSPTLVDLPRGAEVYPDADKVQFMGAVGDIPRDRVTGAPVVINDYTALEARVAANTKAMTRAFREHQNAVTRQMKRMKFNAYLAQRI